MVNYELLRDEGILIIRPEGSLEASDFQKIAQDVDPYIEANGKLRGVMIDAESFPGWKDFAALVAHLKFVREHHRGIGKRHQRLAAHHAAVAAQPFRERHAQQCSRLPVRRIGGRLVIDAFDRQVEILDPGREDLAEDASGVGEAELGFWLRWH